MNELFSHPVKVEPIAADGQSSVAVEFPVFSEQSQPDVPAMPQQPS